MPAGIAVEDAVKIGPRTSQFAVLLFLALALMAALLNSSAQSPFYLLYQRELRLSPVIPTARFLSAAPCW